MSVTNDKLLPLVWMRVRDKWPAGLEPHGFALRQHRAARAGRSSSRPSPSAGTSACGAGTACAAWPAASTASARSSWRPATPSASPACHGRSRRRQEFTVLPRVLDVPGFALLMGRPLVEETARPLTGGRPDGLRGTRPYRPGDPMRAVNWRATARTGVLHTNEFDPTSTGRRPAAPRRRFPLPVLGGHRRRASWSCSASWRVARGGVRRRGVRRRAGLQRAPSRRNCTPVDLQPGARRPARRARGDRPAPAVHGPRLRLRSRAELADEHAEADCVLVTARLRPGDPCDRSPSCALRRPTTVVFVGVPGAARPGTPTSWSRATSTGGRRRALALRA